MICKSFDINFHEILGQNTHKITTATIAGQPKTMAQIQGSPMGTFQILHQSSPTSQNVQSTKTVPTTVTVQQLQQALKQGLVVGPHNLSHTIVSKYCLIVSFN